jgi:hypothetical protein
MRQVSVFSGVSYKCVQYIDRLDPKNIGRMRIDTVMRVAMLLECSPADLIPFLQTRVKGKGKRIARTVRNQGQFNIGEERSMNPLGGFGTREADGG